MQTESSLGEVQNPASKYNLGAVRAILVADCGTVFTKVSLLGLAEGQYRLMARGEAPTTVAAPHKDITRGILQAIGEIERITGHTFISKGRVLSPQQQAGDGVDLFVAAISAGGPIRLVVLGAVSPQLAELAAQAVSGLYAETHAIPSPSFSAASGQGAWNAERTQLEWERQLQGMRELQPHAALIVGKADTPAGATPLQEACQLVINALQDQRKQGITRTAPLPVLYAGAPQYVEAVRRMLHGHAEITRVEMLTSAAQLGPVSMAATALYERDVIQYVPGYEQMRSWSPAVPVGAAGSLSSLVRFLAQHYAMNVTAVDVGASTTSVMMGGERGEFIPMVNAGVGIGPNIGAILQQVGVQRIVRWLPFTITEDELRQYVMNRMMHPQAVPTSQRDLQIIQAFAREAIILTLEEGRHTRGREFSADLILATGGVLAHAPKYGQAMLLLLDALQPRGVTSLVLDRTMLISQLGAVATMAPVAAVQVNENDAVMHRLGTCVVPFGDLPSGQPAIRVDVEYSNGRKVSADVMSGSIEVIPLQVNEQALLSLYPAPTVDVGLGPGERARAAEEIDGGLVGLVIDARGRPLPFAQDDAERQAHLLQWMQVIGA
ncbi:MAG TPA: glutamate mutase L [Ktedonobacteraceae bacterium]|nr:glutamate mutase L [Ktedonobacteraceae bacterium]